MKQFLKNNLSFFCFLGFSCILEFSTLFFITGSFLVRFPYLSLFLLTMVFGIYNLISNFKIKNIFLGISALCVIIVNVFYIILFENTRTYFDFSMLLLIGETSKFSGTVTLNYWYILYAVLLFATFILSCSYLKKYVDESYKPDCQKLFSSLVLVISLIGQVISCFYINAISEERFINNLYKDTNEKYTNYGNSASFLNELAKMAFFNKYNKLSYDEIDEYIYKETSVPTEKYAISKDNNLVTILVESFEWFGFISDPNSYPNEANLSEEELDLLFPNLRSFYNESLIMNNHYSQNKTDISEDEALLGMYPSSAYINYGFPDSVLPSSISNSLKLQDENISTRFFHSNENTFYNRENVATSLGYDKLYFIDDMVNKGLTNYLVSETCYSCMNLDSEVVEVMKDEMFPVDVRFHTHITSISMHGNYVYRDNMKRWHDKLNRLNINIESDALKNYLAAVMEFDNSIGIMMEDLLNKGLLENTTIILFSDHNTYLSDLSLQVKDIKLDNFNDDDYIELYRIPLMIYDKNFNHEVINKFTTTYDITPTILDMFGIKYYKNLYYGNSIFSDDVSILYSKAFNVFIAEGLMFANINNIMFKDKGLSDDYIKEIENKCLSLLKKIYYVNHLFEFNYFKNSNHYNKYINSFNSLNNFHK